MTGAPMVRVRGLTKMFGEFAAVSDVSLEIARGEIFTLLGPNGAGKTTTIRMLMGILQPTAGSAEIDGQDCFARRVEVMRRVGYLPDEPVFYDYLRGREIIRFAGDMHGMPRDVLGVRAVALVERLQLGDALEEFAVNYSKGMRKKLAIVCALLHAPPLLILDEPTNGLDPFATRSVHALLQEHAAGGGSVFFSTHLLDQAEKLCHRVGIMNKGRLAAVGPLAELRTARDATLEEIFFAIMEGARDEPPLEERRP
jgi:ABC-2 type transport system ATP-binding protein